MPASDSRDPSIARAARDAVMHHVDFLHAVAADPTAPRGERLQAIELLARLAELGRPGGAAAKGAAKSAGKTAAKSAGKHAAKHASKQAARSAGKQASKHAAKQVRAGGRKHLAGDDGPKRLTGAPSKTLPPGRS